MRRIIDELTDSDEKKTYARTKEIAEASRSSAEYVTDLEAFASLLDSDKSYVRTRAFLLCCSQARWDREGKLEPFLPGMLALFNDEKPTVVRQCLNAVREVIVFCPQYRSRIQSALNQMDLSNYKDSMRPLIEKDRTEVRKLLMEKGSGR